MTTAFNPKITYRIAGTYVDSGYRLQTPWEYLGERAMSDRDPNTPLSAVTASMRAKWPGNYRVVEKRIDDSQHGYVIKWVLEFDNPSEETMFRLKWAR